ncbi:bifunctional DNA-formamidopyrimidine glycosylase/DNA-(apurinic or apyrimidinic site) lyase [Thioflexithrix psekupsensis]|uniref:Formamidopyrimidine-DNA glycosylase n=1 Tax=Thioflexithrix psekupsensis TaxID=1570016 RepID=A0A251XBS9_9GAMM|nr:bifunctional DNA-formamidopyrimidine glycosylase/DNA-(apurinic or apyrimidinic site) lyase [Thioflexithrix psekupsensis]OUD15763.1 DNA-formamidopyrimidine glycosylase [Thioflexithrix psekupsensis]
MPELPEVETTRLGLLPHLAAQQIAWVHVHQPRLRWPIPENLAEMLSGQLITEINRRGKYLLFICKTGDYFLIHLGMSGSLRLVEAETALAKHDHVELGLASGKILRYHDPRRFGCVLLGEGDVMQHPLLVNLGPEPLSDAFNAAYLYNQTRTRRSAIKTVIMNAHIVVGVGNIYANEALFLAGIDPRRAACEVEENQCDALVLAIRQVLTAAIAMGGTTLRDFVNSSGQPGYFQQTLQVYDRAGQPCVRCDKGIVEHTVLGNRSSYFCAGCQK